MPAISRLIEPDMQPAAATPPPETEPSPATPPRAGEKARAKSFAETLHGLAENWTEERITIGQILTGLGDRGLMGMMLLLALANAIPNPPGTSFVLGFPMLYFSWQILRGSLPWLPQFVAKRSLDTAHFRSIVARILPYLARVEGLLRPRMAVMMTRPAVVLQGLTCLLLTFVLILPIPFGNLLPAVALAMIALGALERDGYWIVIGGVMGIASTIFMAGAIWLMIKLGLQFIGIVI